MQTQDNIVLQGLKETRRRVVPEGGQVWLYGSRARGDARQDSDWDLLILLRKPSITPQDEDDIAYPFVVEGWKHDSAVSPQLYTCEGWESRSVTPYYKNGERDKMLIQ